MRKRFEMSFIAMNGDRLFVTFEKICFIFFSSFFFHFSILHLTFKTLRKMRGRMNDRGYANFVRWLDAAHLPC